MPLVTIACDRCRQLVVGFENELGTGGFYRRGGWGSMFNEGEEIVCDACVQADERYESRIAEE